MSSRDADARMVRRTALRIGLLTAALVAVVAVAVSTAVAILVLRQQEASDRALLAQAVRTADDAEDPPAGMWLAIVRNGSYEATRGIPQKLPDATSLQAALDQGRTTDVHVHLSGRDLQILTAPRPNGAVQAVLDLRTTDRLRTHVVETAVGVGLGGLLAAAAVATVVARRAVRPISKALTMQRAFVADASHELRTPLTLLSTRAQLLRDAIADGEPALTDAEGVVRDAGRLADVVDDLLVAADPRADHDRVPVDLSALCRDVVDSARPYAAERHIELRSTTSGTTIVAAVPAAVRRAVVALLDNAMHHTPPGGQVDVAVTANPSEVLIEVTDSGTGVDPSAADRLFQRFASGGSTTDRRSYGLGLALVRDVATRHGGTVALAPSAADHGARFRLSLPRR